MQTVCGIPLLLIRSLHLSVIQCVCVGGAGAGVGGRKSMLFHENQCATSAKGLLLVKSDL